MVEHTYITDELIKYCSEHNQLSLVANGQEEVRLLTDIKGKHIYVLQGKGAIVSANPKKMTENSKWGYLCVFNDEYNNLYFEVEYKRQKYNIPAEIFDQGGEGILERWYPVEPEPDPVADCCGCQTFSE